MKKSFIFLFFAFICFGIHAQGDNDLQNLTRYPYLQVPVTQTLPSAKVKNVGSAPQTNIVLAVEINGTAVGASAPLASLAPGETAELVLIPAVHFLEGQNIVTYTVSQDETDETPANNVYTFTIAGTRNFFAADNATSSSASYSNSSTSSFGNIFEITATTTIAQVMVDYSTNVTSPVNYSISVYPLTGDLTIADEPLFTQPAVRQGTGVFFINVPPTELIPGRYFLCLNQLTTFSLGLRHDGNTSRCLYRVTAATGNTLVPQSTFGAAAIRMIMEVEDCNTPSNLAAIPKYSSAALSWEGDAVRYEVILNDGTTSVSHITTANSANIINLSMGTTYSWSVVALCDGIHQSAATGTPFTTNTCGTVNQFPFEEGFEDNGTAIPACWTQERIVGTTDWAVVAASTGTPATAHGGAYKIRFFGSTKGNSARLITPPLNLTAISEPVLNFWHTQQNWSGDQDTLKIYYRTSASGEWIHLVTYNNDITSWQKEQIELPDATNDYYIAFVGISRYGRGVQLDDVMISGIDEPTDGHDLQNLTTYPYSQVPKSQILPAGKVKNTGFWTQTNVTLSVELNGTEAGTSEPLAALAPDETADLMLAPAVHVPVGENTMTYTITQDQPDDTPENNVRTFSFKGTQSVFAVDEVVTCDNGSGTVSPFGHIYHITQTATISQVLVGHGMGTYLEYTVSLYVMEDEFTTAATPLFTQEAVRKANGFNIITVPPTLLTPGNYFLCVNQLSSTNASVSYDGNTLKKTYLRASNGVLSASPANVGALAIRMVLETPDCIADQPENLTVVPNYHAAAFSWEGTAPLYFLVTLHDGTQERKFITTNNFITIGEMTIGTPYTWKVAAMCDAINGAEATGAPFSTLHCEVVDIFPYEEGFEENGTNFPTCWFQEHIVGTGNWTVAAASAGTPATAHGGSFKAGFYNTTPNAATRLIMPPMDLSELAKPRLSFWHTQVKQGGTVQDTLKVFYKTSLNGQWQHLATYSENIANWQEKQIELPNATGNYYIAFEVRRPAFVYGAGVQLDDIQIFDFDEFIDGEIAQITAPNEGVNYSLTNSEQVKVLIKNNGDTPLTGFDLKLELDGVEIATETFTASIASEGQALYTFAATLDLSAEATYLITVTAIIDEDEVPENNSKTITVSNYICTTITEFPFTEGFEGEAFPPICWSAYKLGGGTKTWEKCTAHKHSGNASAVHNFASATTEGWLVTPAIEIAETGSFVLEFWSFNEFASDNFYNGVWISTTGNNPATSTFTEVKKLTGSQISYSWQKISIPLSANYAGETIYIGFKYTGFNADSWHIDDFELYKVLGIDGELASIITPNTGEGLAANEEVKVLIKNHGGDQLTGFDLKLELNGAVIATETYTGSIPSLGQAEYTFNAKLNLSDITSYEVKVTIDVAGDTEPDNDFQTKKIGNFSSEVVELLGYRIYDDEQASSPYGFISFQSNNPNSVTRENDYTPPAPAASMWAGEYMDEYFYAYTVKASGEPVSFVKISTKTWSDVSANSVSQIPSDMTYDYTANVMYGIRRSDVVSYLVTINMETGAMTSIGSTGKRLYTLACSPEGVLFTIDGSGNLYTINKTTAALTVVGATGVSLNYIQTMSFDHNTGRLFWAMCNTSDEGKLMELHPATGIAFNRGVIAGNAELIGLFTKPVVIEEKYMVTLLAEPAEGGTLTGEDTYFENEQVTITATPYEKYEFVAWIKGTDTVSKNADYTFNMPAEDLTFTAIFQLKNSINDHTLSNIKVYSHLSSIYIVNEENTYLSAVQVFDMSGSAIYSTKLNSSAVFSLNVATGHYFVRLISEDGRVLVTKVYVTK